MPYGIHIRMIRSFVILYNHNIHSFAGYHIHLNVGECEIMTTISFDGGSDLRLYDGSDVML